MKKGYNFEETLKGITNAERMYLAYNIFMGIDKGIIGETEYSGIRFTEDSICHDKALIKAYKTAYPKSEGFYFRVVSYDNGESWIEDNKIELEKAIQLAYDISDEHCSVEVQACLDGFDSECILYIGTPADNNQNGTDTTIGCIRIAEFQDVKTLEREGLYNSKHCAADKTDWEHYLNYLVNWSNDHKDAAFAGMSPSCFDEWYDNENYLEQKEE